MQAIQRKVEALYDHGLGRAAIAAEMAMPIETVDDYIKRIADYRKANPLPERDEARRSQYERTMGQIRTLHATAGRLQQEGKFVVAAKYHGEVEKREKLVSRIMGTEAPRQIIATTPPGQPFEIAVRHPEDMTTGERRRRIAELEDEEAREAQEAAIRAAAVAAESGG